MLLHIYCQEYMFFYVVLLISTIFNMVPLSDFCLFAVIISMKLLPFLHLTELQPVVYGTYQHVWSVSSTNDMACLKLPIV